MRRDSVNLSHQERFPTRNSFQPFNIQSRHVVHALMQKDKQRCREVDHSDQQTFTASRDCSSPSKCQFYEKFHPKSRSMNSATHRSALAQDLRGSEYQNCQSVSEGCRCPVNPVCVNPECLKTICDTCFNYEECCEGYIGDCGLDCGICIDCDGPDRKNHDGLFFAGSDPELFGDHAAEMFGFGCCLPHFPMETTSFKPSSFEISFNDANAPARTGYMLPKSSFCSGNGIDFFRDPMEFRQELRPLTAVETGNVDGPASVPVFSFGKEWSHSVVWEARIAMDGTASPLISPYQDSSSGERMAAHASPASPLLNSVSYSHPKDRAQNNAGPAKAIDSA